MNDLLKAAILLPAVGLAACGEGTQTTDHTPAEVDCSSARATIGNGLEIRDADTFAVEREFWSCSGTEDVTPIFWRVRFSTEQDNDGFKFNEVRLNFYVPQGSSVSEPTDIDIGSIRAQRTDLFADTPPPGIRVYGTPASPNAEGTSASTNVMATGSGRITKLDAQEGGCFAGSFEVGPISAGEPVYLSGHFVLPVDDLDEEPIEDFVAPVSSCE